MQKKELIKIKKVESSWWRSLLRLAIVFLAIPLGFILKLPGVDKNG